MTDRLVTATAKGENGEIVALCGEWGTRPADFVILQLAVGTQRYYTIGPAGHEVDVVVARDEHAREYLRTDPTRSDADHLGALPDC